jgi:serine/threonine protein kinase
MREQEFRSWLATHRNLGEQTIGSRISNCRTVERHEGDLDNQFDQDKLQELTRRLTYSSRDQVANKPALHNIPIDGNVYNGTATLRSAVSLYKQFRESQAEDTRVQTKTPNPQREPAARSNATTIVQEPLIISPGALLQNRYRIIRKLGEGGMGAVYEALDQRLDCVVALKEATVAGDEVRRAFQREASLLANLRHRALPNVMDHFSESDGHFLVMQFIPGEDLAGMLERRGRFSLKEVLHWADVLLSTLEYLHNRNPPILHRDIKPANLKLTDDDELFLLDFGLAKGSLGQMQTLQSTRSVFGHTPIYSPLEQILGTGTDQRSDIYALGATLYHLISGRKPIAAASRYEQIESGQSDPLPSVNELDSAVPIPISQIISRALAVQRKERFENAWEMREAISRWREGSSGVTVPARVTAQILKQISPVQHDTYSVQADDLDFLTSHLASRQSWIVLLGVPEIRTEDTEIFDQPQYDHGFPIRPGIQPGDILFVHRIGISKIAYVGEVLALPRKSTESEIQAEPWRARWAWSVSTKNLTPEFGGHWREQSAGTFQLAKRYNELNPENQVKISALKFGRHVKIPMPFAEFLIKELMKGPSV